MHRQHLPRKPQRRFSSDRPCGIGRAGGHSPTSEANAHETPPENKTRRPTKRFTHTQTHQRSRNLLPRRLTVTLVRPFFFSIRRAICCPASWLYLLGSSGSWSAIQPSTVGAPAFLRQICPRWGVGGFRATNNKIIVLAYCNGNILCFKCFDR